MAALGAPHGAHDHRADDAEPDQQRDEHQVLMAAGYVLLSGVDIDVFQHDIPIK